MLVANINGVAGDFLTVADGVKYAQAVTMFQQVARNKSSPSVVQVVGTIGRI